MVEPTHPLRVFLCHAHSDKDAVKALYDRLVKDGVDAWLDKAKLLPGQDWELEIREAVRGSDVVVVCLSRQFNQAGYRQKEVRIALEQADTQPEGEIFIIPVRLEECETLKSLRRWHWVDLFDADGYQLLMRALQKRAEKIGAVCGIKLYTFGGLDFVRVPAGKFLMGSTDKNKLADEEEQPQHTQNIPYDFYIARFEVTNQDYAAFAGGKKFRVPKGRERYPVVDVSWMDAQEYLAWLNTTAVSRSGRNVIKSSV